MSNITQRAVNWAVGIANDPAHGYDQAHRWGPDYDCASLVISAYKQAGVPLTCTYTGNMRADMLRHGFVLVGKNDLQPGDVLLNDAAHTALYIGSGKIVAARINERNTTTGGQTGDQTGREICVQNYYDFPWSCVLRYQGADSSEAASDTPQLENPVTPAETAPTAAAKPVTMCSVTLPMVVEGMTGPTVRAMQTLLVGNGYKCGRYGADGEFGPATGNSLAAYQRAHGLEADSKCGALTWAALLGRG